MPVPGPRTQVRPLPGYANPGTEHPDRINLWKRPGPVAEPGRSPGTMVMTLRGMMLAPGQVRRMWKQAANLIAPQMPYSWTHSAPSPEQPTVNPRAVGITRALRYMTRSLYAGSGIDDTRLFGLHTIIEPRARSKPVTVPAGAVRSRPTTRNRLTSFGSRVPPINPRSPASQ